MTLGEELRNLQIPFCEALPSGEMRLALITIPDYSLVQTQGPRSLQDVLAHPDLPDDAVAVLGLAKIDMTTRIFFASQEWEEVSPSGPHKYFPTLTLEWSEEGPVPTGAKPKEPEGPVLCESHEEGGSVEWGVSFSGANPPPEFYVRCYSKEDAHRLHDFLTRPLLIQP